MFAPIPNRQQDMNVPQRDLILARVLNSSQKDSLLNMLVKKGLSKTLDNSPETLSRMVQPQPELIDLRNLPVQGKSMSLQSAVNTAQPKGDKLAGLWDFAKGAGYGATGTPIDESGVKSNWASRLGATIGREFGNTALESALYGETGKRSIIDKPSFYNTPEERVKAASELERAIKIKRIENNLEQERIKKTVGAMGERFRPKSITASGDVTYEYMPTEEEINRDIQIEQQKENIKSPSATQGSANTFVNRMISANKVLSDIDKRGKFGPVELVAQAKSPQILGMQASTPNILKTPEMQKFDQSKRNFINAVLRRESGAVISPEEFRNADLQYFRQPGDSKEVLEQKAENRRIAIEGMKKEAGRAFSDLSAKDNMSEDSQLTDEEAYKIYQQRKRAK